MNPLNPVASKLMSMTPAELQVCYAKVFESIDGQIILEDLKQTCFYYVPENDSDPYQTYSNIGKRSVLLHIFTRLMPTQAKEQV